MDRSVRRAALIGLNKIAEIHNYAKANESEEYFKKIDRSYKKGIMLMIAFVAIIMSIVIGYIVISTGSVAGKKGLATIKQDTIAYCYMDGKYIDIDLADYINEAEVGDKFWVTYDNSHTVMEVQTNDEYYETQKRTGIAVVISFMTIIILGSLLFVVLYRKVVAKDWYEYTQQYRNKSLSESSNQVCSKETKEAEIETDETKAVSGPIGKPKITIGRYDITFTFENGYVLKASGELLYTDAFLCYKDSIKNWEPPHDNEPVTPEQFEELVKQVNNRDMERCIPIEFG